MESRTGPGTAARAGAARHRALRAANGGSARSRSRAGPHRRGRAHRARSRRGARSRAGDRAQADAPRRAVAGAAAGTKSARAGAESHRHQLARWSDRTRGRRTSGRRAAPPRARCRPRHGTPARRRSLRGHARAARGFSQDSRRTGARVVNVVFRGASLDVQPQAVAEKRIAVAQENSPELVALVLGALHGGSEIVLQNARLTAAERAAQLRSIETTVPAGEPATILFTSGTSGAPKAARLALANHLASARAAIEILGIEKNSRFLCAMPMFHAGGLAIVLRCELAGATLLLHERFDAQTVARELHDGNATHVSLVASTLARVLDVCADFPPSVQAVLVGGGPVSPALLERAVPETPTEQPLARRSRGWNSASVPRSNSAARPSCAATSARRRSMAGSRPAISASSTDAAA
ncbi:MAG: 2-succinylbenzoate--CoA ligase [Deltaproteobacteria bacterium]|nr:MAG: 2-succinylbenzoate--CoA ligase [Deltaproteobacteria bacterium]